MCNYRSTSSIFLPDLTSSLANHTHTLVLISAAVGVPLDGVPCEVVVGVNPGLSGFFIALAVTGMVLSVVGITVHLFLRNKAYVNTILVLQSPPWDPTSWRGGLIEGPWLYVALLEGSSRDQFLLEGSSSRDQFQSVTRLLQPSCYKVNLLQGLQHAAGILLVHCCKAVTRLLQPCYKVL